MTVSKGSGRYRNLEKGERKGTGWGLGPPRSKFLKILSKNNAFYAKFLLVLRCI